MSIRRASQSAGDPWYLAQLKPGGLERARTNLARQGYESFMPLREETRRRAAGWRTCIRPLFPGYLFVKIADSMRNWRSINASYGVAKLVALEAGRPTRVDPAIVEALQALTRNDGAQTSADTMAVGDQVRVLSGPFADKLAEIEAVPENGRIYVLLDLMGRLAKAELSTSQVEHRFPATTLRRA